MGHVYPSNEGRLLGVDHLLAWCRFVDIRYFTIQICRLGKNGAPGSPYWKETCSPAVGCDDDEMKYLPTNK